MEKKATIKEVEDIEREIQQSQKKRECRVRRAVNPQRGFGC